MLYMKFLFVRPDVCRQFPSDCTSRWTPLLLAVLFPLLGLIRDLHPLANTHAERTKKCPTASSCCRTQRYNDMKYMITC